MKGRLLALTVASLAVAACMSGDPDAKALEVAQAAVVKEIGSEGVQFSDWARGLSDKGEVNVCGKAAAGNAAEARAFVAILRPGADSVVMESEAMPKDMIDGMTKNVCGPDATQRFEAAKTADASGLVDRIMS